MKYRSRMDIAAAIIKALEFGAHKTRIMQTAMLSFPQLKEYLQLLKNAGLIETGERAGRTIFFASERGKSFLRMYREIDDMVPKENMLTKTS